MVRRGAAVGVLGGMGPLATADFFLKLVQNTAVEREEDHLHVLIDSDPAIPSRREALLGGGPSPAPALRACARRLAGMGADLLAMPCNTAHAFYGEVARDLEIPLLHMPRLSVEEAARRGARRVCLLATDMTLQTGLYHRLLAEGGLSPVLPSPEGQALLMRGIFQGIKRGEAVDCRALFTELERLFQDGGAELLILACTELPLLFAGHCAALPTLDTTRVLARAAVAAAGGRLTAE